MERGLPSVARLRDRSRVLTAATLILLTPPVLTVFDVSVTIFGIPLLHVYCFAVWFAAIAAGAILSRQMSAAHPADGVPSRRGSAEREPAEP